MHKLGSTTGKFESFTDWVPISPDVSTINAAKTAAQWNSAESLMGFAERTSLGYLAVDNTNIHICVTDTPYSDRHLMVVALNDQILHREDWSEGIIIHNLSKEVQVVYWGCALKVLAEFQEMPDASNRLSFINENTCCRVTSEIRLPRAIGAPHAHVTSIPVSSMSVEDPVPEELQAERLLWREISSEFISKLNQNTAVEFMNRDEVLPPAGYQHRLELSGDLGTDSLMIADILENHHYAYSAIMEGSYDWITGLKPQPSYRTYIQIEGNYLDIVISPILTHHVGSVSGASLNAVISTQNTELVRLQREAARNTGMEIVKAVKKLQTEV